MSVGVWAIPVVLYLRYARGIMTGIVSTSSTCIIFRVRTRDDDNIRGSLVCLIQCGLLPMLTRELGRGWKGAVMMKVGCLEHTDEMLVAIMANDFCRSLPIAS